MKLKNFLKTGLSISLIATFLSTTFLLTSCKSNSNNGSSSTKSETNQSSGKNGKLEIFSWWTGAGESDGLKKMVEIFQKENTGTKVVNATIAGGAGSNAKAVLKTRMMGGNPPDSFQVHAGQEVLGWVDSDKLENLDSLFSEEGWDKTFPEGLLDILKIKDHFYSVPVNIHRSNVLWYNKKIFDDNKLTPPKDYDEFFTVAKKLKEKNITPFALGDNGQWTDVHVFENILLSQLGPTDYKGLWNGKTDWSDDRITKTLEIYKKVLDYINTDHSALSWDQAAQYLIDGKAGMMIMGDWADGYFISKKFTNYGSAVAPGTEGTFMMLSDSFALPKGAKNVANSKKWLKLCGSVEGQDAFNPLKGSIPARIDAGKGNYDDYLKSAMKDWKTNKVTPSLTHGAAAKEGWLTDITDAIGLFITKKDVKATQKSLVEIAGKNK